MNPERNDLKVALNPLMTFGKIIGLVPLSNKKFRWNLILIVFLMINVAVDFLGTCRSASGWRTPLDVAEHIGSVTFFANGLFIYYYINRYTDNLYGIFHEWTLCAQLHMVRDKNLFRYANFWGGLIFTSAILENILFHFKLCVAGVTFSHYFMDVLGKPKDPFLICMFKTFGGSWPDFFYPSNFLGLYHIVTNKLALYSWNFMDILIMVLSRAVYFQFDVIGSTARSGNSWQTLRAEFSQAMKLLRLTEEFLSPLVFASYGLNTYALCMQLNMWLSPSRNLNMLDSAYSVWSSLHLVARVLLVSIAAANINASALKVVEQIRNCPNQAYTMDLYRLEEMVTSTPVGLTGLRCFMVTKHFILTLISVVFTFEVVLLQSFAAKDRKY